MKCSQCKLIEMRVESSTDNKIVFKCPKCGQTKTIENSTN